MDNKFVGIATIIPDHALGAHKLGAHKLGAHKLGAHNLIQIMNHNL